MLTLAIKISAVLGILAIGILSSCASSPEKTIVGKWKVTGPAKSLMGNREVLMNLDADQKLTLEVNMGAGNSDTHQGTYEVAKDGKALIVFREGKKDRRNEAEIVSLTANELVLVDKDPRGSGDTLIWSRVK